MQYMLLIYEDERIYGPDRESPAARERRAQHIAYSRELGGYYLIDAPDLDAAIAIAKKVPLAQHGAVEIRPLLVPG